MGKTKIILVIDDEIHNFDVIEALLFKENYDLKYAADGLQALELLTKIKPDLILLDVMMPALDGIEVCRRIRSNPDICYIPIVIATALSSKEDMARCLDAGADDFISKPISGMELRSRVKSMLRIKQQYDHLKEILQLRDDMSTMIVHDLRNPIGNIAFACELLLQGELNEKQKKKIEQIALSGQRLSALTDDLLIMSKMESGKLKLNLTSVDINDLITIIISDFTQLVNNNNIQIVAQLTKENSKISIDANLFHRLVENLLSNAIKFSPYSSQVTIKTNHLDLPGKNIQLQIIDCGLGVKDNLKQSIFNKYEVGTKFENINQIGLGLAFCKMVVDAHQGEISVEDNQPKGSIFTVQI
jgi:two-component system, sensor histidine kinase and response regulator